MFEFLKKMNTLVVNDTSVVTDFSVGFQPPCWWPSGWTRTGRLHKKLCMGGPLVITGGGGGGGGWEIFGA